jgi:hypothetical protein
MGNHIIINSQRKATIEVILVRESNTTNREAQQNEIERKKA